MTKANVSTDANIMPELKEELPNILVDQELIEAETKQKRLKAKDSPLPFRVTSDLVSVVSSL